MRSFVGLFLLLVALYVTNTLHLAVNLLFLTLVLVIGYRVVAGKKII